MSPSIISRALPFFLVLVDGLAITLAAGLSYEVRLNVQGLAHFDERYGYLEVTLFATLLFLVSGWKTYLNWAERSLFRSVRRITVRWVLIVGCLLAFLFFIKASEGLSRIWLLSWSLVSLVLLLTTRIIFHTALKEFHRIGGNARKVVVLGAGPVASQLIERVRESDWTGYEVILQLSNIDLDRLRAIEGQHLDEIWIATALTDENIVKDVMLELRYFPCAIRYVPDLFALGLINHGVSEILGIPMVDLTASKLDGWAKFLKAFEDYVVGLMALILTSPLMILISLVIKLDSKGPVLFKQKRHGLSGKIINVYKFRTMKLHAPTDGRLVQAQKNDHRVTRIGRMLRRTSLDELPQLFNVILGEMSIVGPRPHAVEHNHQFKPLVDSYMKRHIVKPGITGWAQVNGFRGETDTLEKMEGRVRCDIYYIEHWSLMLDIKIMILTLLKGMMGRHVY